MILSVHLGNAKQLFVVQLKAVHQALSLWQLVPTALWVALKTVLEEKRLPTCGYGGCLLASPRQHAPLETISILLWNSYGHCLLH